MVVVAIIGLLSAILVPKFVDMIIRSKEATVKGQLGAIRGALNIYYADNEGFYPDPLDTGLTANGRYLSSFPVISIPSVDAQDNPGHSNAGAFGTTIYNSNSCPQNPHDFLLGMSWLYGWDGNNFPACYGQVLVDCSHLDSKGVPWSTY